MIYTELFIEVNSDPNTYAYNMFCLFMNQMIGVLL